MVSNMRLKQTPGGNRHPIAVKQFILDYLARMGEDYAGGIHQAYKRALDQHARDIRRKYLYHHPSYQSFYKKVHELMDAGRVEFTGREQQSDDPAYSEWQDVPIRKFIRLKR